MKIAWLCRCTEPENQMMPSHGKCCESLFIHRLNCETDHSMAIKFKDPNSMERMRTPWLRLESSTRSCANSKYHDGIHSYLFQMDMTEDQLVTVS